jgi:hypothetical protein
VGTSPPLVGFSADACETASVGWFYPIGAPLARATRISTRRAAGLSEIRAATLALAFSMSGGALAARRYLVNSTKQINPKVLKEGAPGPGAQWALISAVYVSVFEEAPGPPGRTFTARAPRVSRCASPPIRTDRSAGEAQLCALCQHYPCLPVRGGVIHRREKAMHRRLSYANVAATLALVFSMSGGALAATHYLVTSTKQISPKVLKSLKGNSGATGAQGKEGPQGREGAQGKEGAAGKEGAPGHEGKEGAAGSAVAYAHVLESGTVESATSKNIASANVSHPSAGIYCLSGLTVPVHNVEATVDFNTGATDPEITATLGVGGGSGCAAGTEVTIGTLSGATLLNRDFFVTIN